MRCFVAIDFPINAKTRIFHESKKLQGKDLFDGNLTKKENLHLTIKFLGSLTNKEVEKIKEKLRKINFNKFFCKIGKVGFFYKGSKIRIIWVDLLSNKLNELQKKIGKVILDRGNEKFSSHITIFRLKSVRNKRRLVEKVGEIDFKNLNFKVKEFVLMKSELTNQGIRYRILDRFKSEN